jgi:hypothetical protein
MQPSVLSSRATRWATALACAVTIAFTEHLARAQAMGPMLLEIVSGDGRSWDAVMREVQSDPATSGRVYRIAVRSWGIPLRCADYDLSLDPVASLAFANEGCDLASGTTRLRVVDRSALFAPGDVVPRPRTAAVHAVARQSADARGGAEQSQASSKLWCSVALMPTLWDGLHGVVVPLPPDRFELRPLEEHVHAAPDGSGWVVHGESRMTIRFHYEVIDRASGDRVLEDVATLACEDGPVAPAPPPADVAPAPAPVATLIDPISQPARSTGLDSRPLSMDLRLVLAGGIFGATDVQLEEFGLVLGVGWYVSDRWYVGGSARWGLALDVAGESGMTNVLQVGPEARYAFHIGTGSVRHNGGPPRPIPYIDWVGVRTGFEDVGPGSSSGAFAEIAWGSEFRMGSFCMGTVMAAGAGFDSPGAYGDGSVVHPYVDLALRFGLNL